MLYINETLRTNLHIFHCAKNVPGLAGQIRFQQHKMKCHPSFCTPKCSPVIFAVLLKNDFEILFQGLLINSRVSFTPLEEVSTSLCDQHLSAGTNSAHKICSGSIHSLHSDLSNCRPNIFIRSAFRFIPFVIDYL